MLQYDLNAQVRTTFGKSAAKSMRRDGITPAVLYGAKTEPVALQFNTKELTKTLLQLQRRNAVFNVEIEENGSTARRHVMLKEVQTHPITDDLVHTDFCEISLEKPMVIEVPLKFSGKAKGVELGGDLIINTRTVKVKGPVLSIPNDFELNVSNLGIGDSIKCGDISMPEGVNLLDNADIVCVAVYANKRESAK